MKQRCNWAQNGNQLLKDYHDTEWGVPTTTSQQLFELLTLEAFQSGLSWQLILNKRENFKQAFDNFDFEKIAHYDNDKIISLMHNSGIIRNKRKIIATINNAKIMQTKFPNNQFSEYVWSFTGNHTIIHHYASSESIPKYDQLALIVSKQLKKAGFAYAGPVTTYSFLQAAGIINDHQINCFKK
ncbi:DNA-3-methyladenine glycosylase I [Weissella sagaensis]|jgi:DNA-3-methyladenine glycosylase I|uniref:DNA-3-methyladenine glycosylase I n=1 Tax=Weissella sagaensis TaxID=2559928 RepID=A0ABW1RUF9_9LACO|nr:DNA-3-methyladenine glycosylase I [Weissella sagaensis]MBU7567914.1 DNA-3-methyladenine glycosylase I [Weissella hellenica]QDJ58783.1 DNA-3-methyladenine glycosylase I [Weissella hellenica]QEA57732.1 DNA-3-methyladenine glycosylase I [Weissella hellenica]